MLSEQKSREWLSHYLGRGIENEEENKRALEVTEWLMRLEVKTKIQQALFRVLVFNVESFEHDFYGYEVEKIISDRPIAIDLFSGVGGMGYGFEMAGFDIPVAVEIDPVHCFSHKRNFPFWETLCLDIREASGEHIRRAGGLGDRSIDVVFGGPPCQGFSQMGKQQLGDPRNNLIFEFARLVFELQPKYFVIENVKGLTAAKYSGFLESLVRDFDDNGYGVVLPYQVLNAANYCVPQNRERVFLLGFKKGLPEPNYPPKITANPRKKKESLPPVATVWKAIGDLPRIENYPELFEQDYLDEDCDNPSDYSIGLRERILAEDYSIPRDRIRDCIPNLVTGCFRTKHSQKIIERFKNTPHGEAEPVSRFFRLHPDGIANTLRAGTPSGRGSHTSPRPIHPFEPRCITVREAARLHSYPDWFRFHPTKWHGFRQIGNSVPPYLAWAIAAEIIKLCC